jgi:hypothetical protein
VKVAKIMENTLDRYARDAWRILATSLELVEQGRSEFYRVAALELRLLLCDTTRRHNRLVDISLARRIWPGLRLSPLNSQGQFDAGLELLDLDAWLAQPIPLGPGRALPLRELVRRVCDQDGGAHVDPKPRAGLHAVDDARRWICLIGAETLRALEKAAGGKMI